MPAITYLCQILQAIGMPDIKTQTKIAVLIEKINYLFSTVQQNGGALTKIDKDLMMNYVKELYECTLSLQVEAPHQPQQYQQQNPQQQPQQYQQYSQPQQQQPPPQENYPPQQQQPQQYQPPAPQPYQPPAQAPQQNQQPTNNGHANGYQNGSQQLNGNGNGNYVPPQQPQPGNEPAGNGHSINQNYSSQGQRKTLSDMYTIKTGAEKPSVNEKLNQPKHELADKLKKSPIKDLKVYIGLNKRFSYINFLFNNDAKLYDEAINTINGSANYDSAMRYIEQELLPRLKWQADDETVAEFYNIVERRYLA